MAVNKYYCILAAYEGGIVYFTGEVRRGAPNAAVVYLLALKVRAPSIIETHRRPIGGAAFNSALGGGLSARLLCLSCRTRSAIRNRELSVCAAAAL